MFPPWQDNNRLSGGPTSVVQLPPATGRCPRRHLRQACRQLRAHCGHYCLQQIFWTHLSRLPGLLWQEARVPGPCPWSTQVPTRHPAGPAARRGVGPTLPWPQLSHLYSGFQVDLLCVAEGLTEALPWGIPLERRLGPGWSPSLAPQGTVGETESPTRRAAWPLLSTTGSRRGPGLPSRRLRLQLMPSACKWGN